MMNNDVRIVTFNRAHNYGASLQAYALQENIKGMKKNVKIIDYRNHNIEDMYKPLNVRGAGILSKVKRIIIYCIYQKKLNSRYKNFENFFSKYFELTNSYYSKMEIENDKDNNCCTYITGSDQVWNRNITKELSDIYTLNFKINGGKRISYAASIGDVSLVEKYKEEYISKIGKIQEISVREYDAKVALNKYLKNDIEVVLDPTLLLTTEEWNKKISNNPVNVSEKYILAYMVEDDEEYIKVVNDLSEQTENVLFSAYSDGPMEFIKYIKDAQYVVATSFHATVFSILFHKRFFIVPHKRTGSRVTGLLKILGINGRTINTLEEFRKIDWKFETNWNEVDEKLQIERAKSIKWLENALEG